MRQYSKRRKRGCPTCGGLDARSCMRCWGRTWLTDWWETETGWAHYPRGPEQPPADDRPLRGP